MTYSHHHTASKLKSLQYGTGDYVIYCIAILNFARFMCD